MDVTGKDLSNMSGKEFAKLLKQPEKNWKEVNLPDKDRCATCGTYDYVAPLPIDYCDSCTNKLSMDAVERIDTRADVTKWRRCFKCKKKSQIYNRVNVFCCMGCLQKITDGIEKIKEREEHTRKKLAKKIRDKIESGETN